MAHRIARPLQTAMLAAACALATTTTTTARAEEVRTIAPATAESPGHPDALLATTGLVVFGAPYLFSVTAAAGSDVSSDRWLYVPVVGPLGDIISRLSCPSFGCRGDAGSVALPLALDGLAQASGVAILVTTFASPGKPPPSAFARAGVHVLPSAYAGGGGVSAFGAF